VDAFGFSAVADAFFLVINYNSMMNDLENDKESRNSTQPIASFRGKDVHYDGSLTPVGSELDVHAHNHVCPEIEERLVPKRHLHGYGGEGNISYFHLTLLKGVPFASLKGK
jgi:hypothetical protein